MNIICFYSNEFDSPISITDTRVIHIIKILKKNVGDTILAGVIDKENNESFIGQASIQSLNADGMRFAFFPQKKAPPLFPIELILGMVRPIQAKRIVKDIATLGVRHIIFTRTELTENSYMQSSFYKNKEFEPSLLEASSQSGNPRQSEVDTAWTLKSAISKLHECKTKIAFDPYLGLNNFGSLDVELQAGEGLGLAIGSERGWTKKELDILLSAGFTFFKLGERILKAESAALSAVTIALAKLGLM